MRESTLNSRTTAKRSPPEAVLRILDFKFLSRSAKQTRNPCASNLPFPMGLVETPCIPRPSKPVIVQSPAPSEAPMKSWPVQDAKARFSELLGTCLREGPQLVTKRGAEAGEK